MARSNDDIFKKYGDKEIFVIGDTNEERAKILYIRSGMTAKQIAKRLNEWGDLNLTHPEIQKWVNNGEWRKLRKKYAESYDKKFTENIAAKQADADADGQQLIRNTYAEISAQLMNMVHQKLKFSTPSMGQAAIINPKDILDLSTAMKNSAEVHFRALGIAEISIVDPTIGQKGITMLTKQDAERLESLRKG